MKNQLSLLLLGASLLFIFSTTACKPNSESGAENSNETTSSALYRQMNGQLGGQPVTMYLCRRLKNDYEGKEQTLYYGYYYYDAHQAPIFVEGTPDSSGQLVLMEYSDPEVEKKFVGTMAADMSSFSGNWQEGQRKVPFKLEAATAGINFDNPSLKSLVKLRPELEHSPEVSASFAVLWPRDLQDDGLENFLRAEITRGMLGDSAAIAPSKANDLLLKMQKEFFDGYAETMKEMGADTITFSEDNSFSYSYSREADMAVLWNTTSTLSLSFFTYEYTGGAHGNYGTGLMSYDLVNKKVINLEHVFKPGFEEKLNAALEKAVRQYFKLDPGTPLTNILFENEIAYNENYCLAGKGILFNYVPYEIAPYAAGEIRLFVPFSEIRAIVKDQWLK